MNNQCKHANMQTHPKYLPYHGCCICIYVYMYICIYVYMYICIYVYMYICIYVFNMYICIYWILLVLSILGNFLRVAPRSSLVPSLLLSNSISVDDDFSANYDAMMLIALLVHTHTYTHTHTHTHTHTYTHRHTHT